MQSVTEYHDQWLGGKKKKMQLQNLRLLQCAVQEKTFSSQNPVGHADGQFPEVKIST